MKWEEITPVQRDALVEERVMERKKEPLFWGPDITATIQRNVPYYTANIAAACLVEGEIDRQGLRENYVWELCQIAAQRRSPDEWYEDDLWKLIRATPEQRCHAALRSKGVDI